MAVSYTQKGRPIRLTTPLGDDAVLLNAFRGVETLSALFRYELDLFAPASQPVAFDAILGQSVTLSLEVEDGSTRSINGIVVRFSQGQRVARGRRRDDLSSLRRGGRPQALAPPA